MMCIPVGQNLYETFCYCLIPYPNREVMIVDSALWERDTQVLPLPTPKQMAAGYADLFTWQPRMIFLEELPLGGVSQMRFVAGKGFENPSNNPDPMQPYKADKIYGKLPVRFRDDRGTWRDFDSLLPDNSDLAPLTIQHAIRLAGKKVEKLPKSVLVLGLKYEPPSANVDLWRMEHFVLPKALAGEHFLQTRTEIRQLLTDAEASQKELWTACRNYARDLLGRGEREPAAKDISEFVKQMSAISWYWSALESKFHDILGEYSLDRDPEDIRCQWLKSVRDTLGKAWQQHSASVSMGDAWAIRALVRAENPVLRKLKELKNEIEKLERQEEEV
jgi:CRISPR system Cascade subunit CasA